MHITDQQIMASLAAVPSTYLLFNLLSFFCLFTLTWRTSSSPSHPCQPLDPYHWLTWWISPAPLPSLPSRDWLLFRCVWCNWRTLWGPTARRRLCKIISTLSIIYYFFLSSFWLRFHQDFKAITCAILILSMLLLLLMLPSLFSFIHYLFGITSSPLRPRSLLYLLISYIYLLFFVFC